jgi:hypothetical protein
MYDGRSGFTWLTGTASGFLSGVIRGFGWVPVFLSVPGVLAAVLRRRDARSLFLGVALFSWGLVTLFAGYWLPRYFLSLLVLASVFAAVALGEILRATGLVLGRRAPAVALGFLVLTLGGNALRWEWRTRGRCIHDVVCAKRQDFIRTNVRGWELADWVNRNLGPDDKIGVGMSVQPFYYMRRPYFHINPNTEKGNLQSLQTPEEFLRAFRALGLTWLALSPYFDRGIYPVETTPHMHTFFWRFDRARKALARSGKLTYVITLEGVRIYRIEAPQRDQTQAAAKLSDS